MAILSWLFQEHNLIHTNWNTLVKYHDINTKEIYHWRSYIICQLTTPQNHNWTVADDKTIAEVPNSDLQSVSVDELYLSYN